MYIFILGSNWAPSPALDTFWWLFPEQHIIITIDAVGGTTGSEMISNMGEGDV